MGRVPGEKIRENRFVADSRAQLEAAQLRHYLEGRARLKLPQGRHRLYEFTKEGAQRHVLAERHQLALVVGALYLPLAIQQESRNVPAVALGN